MQIQRGKLYENKTWRYLFPCLRFYGEDLMNRLAGFFKLAVGVRDYNREDKFNCIYILIDTNLALSEDSQIQRYKNNFAEFLEWLRYQEYYVTDYIYEKDMHMVALKLPNEYNATYMNFIQGKYSIMYNLKEKRDYFRYIQVSNKEAELKHNTKLKITKDILDKDNKYVATFVKIVNGEYKSNATREDFLEAELDFPPIKKEEIFNFEEVKEVI